MMELFESPQTGSVYTKVNTGETFVCYRSLGDNEYRIRIQGDAEILEQVLEHLPECWGSVKSDDHVSVVVKGQKSLAHAVGHAVKAVLLVTL